MAKACRLDVKNAIIKTAAKRMDSQLFSPVEESIGSFYINNSARKVGDKYNTKRNDILNQAKKDILKLNKVFKDRIRAVLVKTDDTSDIQVMLKVDPMYVENEFSKLPEDRRNNVFVDLEEDQTYFEDSQSIFEQDFTEGMSQTDLDNLFSYTRDIDEVTKPDQQSFKQIKPGVAELFESTPELANAVYEALGFRKTIVTEIGKVFKDPSKFSQEDYDTLEDMGYTQDEILDKLGAKKSDMTFAKTIVTPEQKQQALQLYSQYLDTIFPDGKILYHASMDDVFEDFDSNRTYKSSNDLGPGFYLSDKKNIDTWVSYAEESKYRQEAIYLEKLYKNITDQLGKRYPLDELDLSQDMVPTMPNLGKFILFDLYPGIPYNKSLNITNKKDKDVVETVFEEFKKMRESEMKSGKEVSDLEVTKLILSALIDKNLITDPQIKEPTLKANVLSVLTNFSKPKVKSSYEEYWENKKLQRKSIIFEGDENDIYQIVFKNPERDTRILGGAKDIERFKKFVKQDRSVEEDKENKFVEDKTLPEEEKPATQEEKNKLLNSKVYEFLGKIGVSIVTLDTIRDADGNVINAAAKADILNKVIQVVENKASMDTLPEEAAHFFVAMLGEGHPLYKQMFNKIEGYEVYQTTLDQYKNKAAYRLPNGDINYDKIKKEAIGKVIAQHIINMDPGGETDANLETLYNWWQKLWEFVTDIFNRTTDNPFEEAAVRILMGETEGLSEENITEKDDEYYQLVDPLQGLLADQLNITLDNSIDPRTQQKRHIYYYGGVQGKGSVTSTYVDRWLKKIFRSDNRTELQKKVDLLKAEFGDVVHEQIQDIVKSWTNPDGTRKDVQDKITPNDGVGKAEFKILNDYIAEILDQYDPVGTRFFAELKIFDKKTQIAGSIDLLVVEPDGTVEIYDWKSQEIYKDQTDIKGYKEPMYRIQLNAYRNILEAQYGFKKFGRIRAFPIATSYNYRNGQIASIKSIEVGSLDLDSIPEEKSYLLPVALRTETTGDNQLDGLIQKLYAIYDKIQNQKNRYSKEEVFKKREELAQFKNAIRDLQLRNKVDKLVELGLVEFKKYSDELENKTLKGGRIPEALSILRVFSQSGITLYELRQELLDSIDKEDKKAVEAFREMNEKFLLMTSKVSKLISDIEEYRKEQTDELGKRNGIMGLLNPEQAVGTLKGWFASLSNIKQKSFRVFSKLLRRAQNIRDAKFDETSDKLLELKKGVATFAASKGMSIDKAMNMMLNIDEKGKWNGNFLSVYEKDFYTGKEKAIKENDYTWLSENLEYDQERYEAAEKKQIEFFNSVVYAYEQDENEATIDKKIKEWISLHRVINPNGKINLVALSNSDNRFLKPKDKWHTAKWKELNKPENKPVKEAYEYFRSLVKESENNGMLDKHSPHFIPSVMADKMDQLVFGDIKTLFSGKGTFENLEVDSGTQYTPETDPTTGQIINRIPVYFTRDMGVKNEETGEVDYSKKSRDLFKVFGIWAAHMYNYEAMASIEDDAQMIVEVEKNKSSLVVDGFGRIVMEGGRPKQVEENRRNSELLENFVNYYLYDRTNGKFNDVSIPNPFSKSGKRYSLLKTVNAAIRFFSLKTLGLNIASGTANFVGGNGNALFTAQKGILFTKQGWASAMYKVTSLDKKSMAALDYMNVLLEGRQRNLINELSLSSTNQILNSDNLFIIQRTSDKAVQYPVAIAIMENNMIREGKLVDISAYVKEKYDYNNTFYSLSSSERASMMAKIEAEVTELKEKESILAIGKLDENGKFSIPGVTKTEEGVYGELRDKIKATSKKILGNSSRDDINAIRTTMLGSALMQFRNWMPEMIEDRFAGLQYDDELGIWTYGRVNQWVTQGFWKNTTTMLKSIVTGFGDDAITSAKNSYERLKRDAYEKGEEFDITEGEFVDMYIGNLRSMGTELLILMAFTLAILSVAAATGDDDDKKPKGLKSYGTRILKKYYAEFAFYFNPIEFTKLTKSPLPVIGLAEDFFRFSGNLIEEGVGQVTGNEKLKKSAKPMKYLFRALPIAKEALLMMAAFDDDFRKEWDIQLKPGGY